jgi:eukaryotic-like serine/threonine-protein kinase
MPSPSNVPEFLALLRQSGLVEEPALTRFLQRQQGAQAQAPVQIAKVLVRGKLLTPWQAEQLLQGRCRFEIDRYIVLEQIGAGGMAAVYLCQHKHMKRQAAVKVLPARMAADPSSLARFYHEGHLLAKSVHPGRRFSTRARQLLVPARMATTARRDGGRGVAVAIAGAWVGNCVKPQAGKAR